MPQFNALDEGLYRRLVDRSEIDVAGWNRVRSERGHVGTCRSCGSYLVPLSVERHGGIDWYEARCLSCGKEVAAPDGRTLRRSSRHSEMPPGWWEARLHALADE